MFPRSSRSFLAAATASAMLAIAVVGCGAGPAGSAAPTGQASSGTAACPTAPTPPDDLAGWTKAAQSDVVPLLINPAGQVVCGTNRVLFTLTDQKGAPVGAPDRTAGIAFYDLARDPTQPIASVNGTFVWAIKDTV